MWSYIWKNWQTCCPCRAWNCVCWIYFLCNMQLCFVNSWFRIKIHDRDDFKNECAGWYRILGGMQPFNWISAFNLIIYVYVSENWKICGIGLAWSGGIWNRFLRKGFACMLWKWWISDASLGSECFPEWLCKIARNGCWHAAIHSNFNRQSDFMQKKLWKYVVQARPEVAASENTFKKCMYTSKMSDIGFRMRICMLFGMRAQNDAWVLLACSNLFEFQGKWIHLYIYIYICMREFENMLSRPGLNLRLLRHVPLELYICVMIFGFPYKI